ncbi:MAG: DUF167 domain-containing protein [Methanomethylophilus sp.]
MPTEPCPNMEIADVSRPAAGGLEIDLLVSPKASKAGIGGFDEWRKRLIVRVRAPPLEGRANREVEVLLAQLTGRRTAVIAGQTSRQKTVLIAGDPEEICADLQTKT